MLKMEAEPQAVDVEHQIVAARQGSRSALDQLFVTCLPYLYAAAHRDLGAALRARLDAADMVQETLIEACRDFACFQGQTESDLLAWLRQILRHNLANERRRHTKTAMRNVRCEVPLTEAILDRQRSLAHNDSDSPSARVQAQERSEIMERALRRLPKHYRQVLWLRTWEELTFAQVGDRLHCSSEAARKLWGRAAAELASVLGDAHAAWQQMGRG